MTLISIQESAIDRILQAKEQGRTAMSFGRSFLNRNPRVLRGIRKTYTRQAVKLGYDLGMIEVHWTQIKEMAELQTLSE